MTSLAGLPPGEVEECEAVADLPPAIARTPLTDEQRARSEWLAWRRQGIGGSDIAALMGHSRWASPWSLWAEKTGLYIPPDHTTERQQIGLDLELAIAGMFCRKTGLHVSRHQARCERPGAEWARCTVDGYVTRTSNPADPLIGGFEAKTDGRFSWPDGIPVAYQCQGQWNMWVTGLPRWWFAVLHAGFKFEVYELQADPDDQALIASTARTFWHDHVLTGNPPATDGSDATLEAIAEVWPTEQTGTAIELDDDAVMTWTKWRAARAARLDAEKEEAACKAALEAVIADAETATVSGRPVLSYRTQTTKGYVRQPATFRVLREIKPKPNKE